MPLLGQLRLFQALLRRFEIGAGILPVLVEEQAVQLVAEIVVVGHIALRAPRSIALAQAPRGEAQPVGGAHQRVRPQLRRRPHIAHHQRQEVVDRAGLDQQSAVGIQLAQAQLGIGHEAPLRHGIAETDAHRRTAAVAEAQRPATRRHHRQIAAANQVVQAALQQVIENLAAHETPLDNVLDAAKDRLAAIRMISCSPAWRC